MLPVPVCVTPPNERLERLIYVPEVAPIFSVLLPPRPNDNYYTHHPSPPAPAVVLSTPTAATGLAFLGWTHADSQQPLSADELLVVLDRAAILRAYLALLSIYKGRLRTLLADWSLAGTGGGWPHELVANAVRKARSACLRLLPSHAQLQQCFQQAVAPTTTDSFALLLRRLLARACNKVASVLWRKRLSGDHCGIGYLAGVCRYLAVS